MSEDDREELKSVSAIQQAIRSGQDILGKGEKFRIVPVDDTFPKPLVEQRARYESLIKGT